MDANGIIRGNHEEGEAMKNYKSVLTAVLAVFCVTQAFAEAPPLYKTINDAKAFIVQHQNRDGGWPLVPEGESDVEITGLAIWALIDAGWGTGSQVIRRGVAYLRHAQHENGSWNDNTAHTIFAVIALAAAETDADARFKALRWLRAAQNPVGSWGTKERTPSNILYTAAVIAGFKRLNFKFEREFDADDQDIPWLSKGCHWLSQRINFDGGWSLQRSPRSDVFVTAWVLQGLAPVYDIDAQIAWLKQMQNQDGGFGRYKGQPSDPGITAAAIMALAAGADPLNTRRVAINYLITARQADGSYISDTPIELSEPTANLQSTCFVLIAIHAKKDEEE